jgi:hypothetical protein
VACGQSVRLSVDQTVRGSAQVLRLVRHWPWGADMDAARRACLCLGSILVTAAALGSGTTVRAQETTPSVAATETAAHYAAQREHLVAYVECLKDQYKRHRDLTASDAAGRCADPRVAYAATLPAGLVSLRLQEIDYRVFQDFSKDRND